MPCGGIEPLKGGAGTISDRLTPSQYGCWVCHRGGCRHFCHEWDTFIHAACALVFLAASSEGFTVLNHKHEVVLDFSLEEYGCAPEEYVKRVSRAAFLGGSPDDHHTR